MSQLTAFASEIRALIVADLQLQLPGQPVEPLSTPSEKELARLMMLASALASSVQVRERRLAYEIATRIIELTGDEYPGFLAAAEIILARLGNFPGRALLRERYTGAQGVAEKLPATLVLEAVFREIENTILGPDDNPIALTDFQFELFTSLAEARGLSVSAPTSAGKSFVLSLSIVERLKSHPQSVIVYVVPTRALMRQIMLRIAADKAKAGMKDTPIRCIPIPAPIEPSSGAVYVLTQERLLSLLNSDEGCPPLTTLIVDEAQGIGDGSRGVVLQAAIDTAIARFPNIELIFASPETSNPEYLLKLFGRDGESWTESISPVSQNRILVSGVQHQTHAAAFEFLGTTSRRLPLGIRYLPFVFRGRRTIRRARFAVSVTGKQDSAIIFANEPKEAEEVADALCKEVAVVAELPQPVAELIDFLQEFVHAEYPLIRCLKHQIAFHYGQMPASARTRVEELAEQGVLKFICCTSTLLHGVNLPARHIIIEKPRKGRGKTMDRGDFLNLAGRAGRLLKEFHGNIWCIDPTEWREPAFEAGDKVPLSAAFEEVLADGGRLINRALEGSVDANDRDLADAALGKVFVDYILPKRPLKDSPFSNESAAPLLELVEEKCSRIRITLPHSIIRRNFTIPATRLQELYDYLLSEEDLLNYTPIAPFTKGTWGRLRSIFRILQVKIEGVDNNSFSFHSWLAAKWIHNVPLHRIISDRLEFLGPRAKDVGTEIRGILEAIESDLRYRYVRNLRAYDDILGQVLRERGFEQDADALVPLYLYVECGASDPAAISLISLGLSRTTALLLMRRLPLPDNPSPEQCVRVLEQIGVSSLALPPMCRHEVEAILGL